jgi:hypothetical protein
VFRPETFLSGGPFSETEVTILISGPSASGRTGPSTMTITPGASVPLPGAVWLVGTALIVLVGVRRQSRL